MLISRFRGLMVGVMLLAVVGPARSVSAQRPLAWRLHEMTAPWRERLDDGEDGVYALIGDSIAFRIDSFNWFLRDELEAIFGNGGDGYLALNSSFGYQPGSMNRRPGLAFRHSGQPWALFGPGNGNRDQFGERSIDGLYARIGATGWVEVDLYGPQVTLHYVREFGAGVIRVQVNGQTVGQVNASALQGELPSLSTYTFSTGASDPDVLSTVRFSLIGATTQSPMWTQLNGLDMRAGEPGVVYHRLARGGSGPDDFLRTDPFMEQTALTALAPDVIFIMLDQTTPISQFEIDLPLYVARIQVARPGTPIVLISHHAFHPTREATTDIQLALAMTGGYGFLNLFDLHEGFDHLDDLGFILDTVHFTPAGGDWFGRFVRDALLGWRVPSSESVPIGYVLEGELYELRAIDDDRRLVRSQLGFSAIEPYLCEQHVTIHIDPADAPTLMVTAVMRSDTPGTSVSVRLKRRSDQAWVPYWQGPVGPFPVTCYMDDITASWYVDENDGSMNINMHASHVAVFSALGFTLSIDRIAAGAE